jgi:two-component system chemotaxis sensor kinase CheA
VISLAEGFNQEQMLDMYIFETTQLIEQLEQSIIDSEKSGYFSEDAVNQIFRIMHTIKGSSAMMGFNNISTLTHLNEDLFYFIRDNKPENIDHIKLSDIVLESVDFIKAEVEKISEGENADGESSALIARIEEFLDDLKAANNYQEKDSVKSDSDVKTSKKQSSLISSEANSFKALVFFEEGCEMENIRAFGIVHNLQEFAEEIEHVPEELLENDQSKEIIQEHGFKVFFKTDRSHDELKKFFKETALIKSFELDKLETDSEHPKAAQNKEAAKEEPAKEATLSDNRQTQNGRHAAQNFISVSVAKLDTLMDLVGEMVIAEAMVTQNPDLEGLDLHNFQKAAGQLNKITNEIQETVMSIRMVPLSGTFLRMHRIVRDMRNKTGKEVQLKIIGEETEVDRNVIERISDPLMHLVRNSIDHGIEPPEERLAKGKPKTGTVTLEAKNAGNDVLIIVKDDGNGLDRESVLKKAKENGLLHRPEAEMSDKEVYNLIFLPGFSTKDSITEFSGRGVGMDVVVKNIEAIGGSVSVDSSPGNGTAFTMKIPLTLAIIDGMNVKVGQATYTIPTLSIKESIKAKEKDLFADPDGNEMIMVRGQCFQILRLHELFKVDTRVKELTEGIIIMTEQEDKTFGIFVDELLGQQQIVVKALPKYIRSFNKTGGIAACTLLGDGGISLILDIAGLTGYRD